MKRLALMLAILLLPVLAWAQPQFMSGSRTTTVLTGVTARLDAAADSMAFLWIDGTDLSSYAETGGKRCRISIYDTTNGKWLVGFAGAVGAGETLDGTEKVTNGGNEAAVYTTRLDVRSTSAQSTDVAKSGTYSAKTTSDGTPSNNFYSRFSSSTMTSLALYKTVGSGYNLSAQNIGSLYLRSSINGTIITTNTNNTKDSWVTFTQYGTNSGTSWYLAIITPDIVDPTGKYFYVDDYSCQRVTDPPSTALRIH